MSVLFSPVRATLAGFAAAVVLLVSAAGAFAQTPPADDNGQIPAGGKFKECHGYLRHVSDLNLKVHCIDGNPSDQSFLYIPKYANLRDGKSVQTKNLHPDTPIHIFYTQSLGIKKAYKIYVADPDGHGLYGFRTSLLALAATFVLVPLDDRPVTLQLPKMLGAVAGVRVATPPRPLLGNYLTPGDPQALARWLRDESPRDASAFILSTDMIDFGGLVASRAPGTPAYVAQTRLRDLAKFRAQRPNAQFSLFGTVMRLAPTGLPAIGGAAHFFAAGSAVEKLTQYANLPDPPQTDEQKTLAAKLAAELGPDLPAYLGARARDRAVDLFALQLTAEGAFDRIVIGQDDAGPVGLHLRDLAALRSFAQRWLPPERAAIEPGADELGMILTGAALAREAHLTPRVRVRYSRADGATVQDPLEFAPIDTTIADIIRACGATRVTGDAPAEIDLFVRVAGTNAADESTFENAIAAEAADAQKLPRPAVADLTFLDAGNLPEQRALVEAMIARGIAGKIDAFASWNTTANTIGTAIPVAIAALAGRAMHSFDPVAHAQFMLDRYADDYAFHDFVRGDVNTALSARGIDDHTYLLPDAASFAASANRSALWPRALALLSSIYPLYRDMGLTITLPWDRTFETELDVRLVPRR